MLRFVKCPYNDITQSILLKEDMLTNNEKLYFSNRETTFKAILLTIKKLAVY